MNLCLLLRASWLHTVASNSVTRNVKIAFLVGLCLAVFVQACPRVFKRIQVWSSIKRRMEAQMTNG